MDDKLMDAIESAALNAWPAPRQMMYDGWLLRFTSGESKRVNSVNVRYPSMLPLDEKIRFCEAAYAHQRLPVIFRLLQPFTSEKVYLALERAGYREFDPTYVLRRELQPTQALPTGVSARALPAVDWLELRAYLMAKPLAALVHHAAVLSAMAPERALLALFVDDVPVACGMGVVEGELLGYFSIYTRQGERRKGFGKLMMDILAAWGRERNASYGYLQVEGDNYPALKMYDTLGFEKVYGYSYSKKE